ncbi:sigma-70 family RNA polymerase sigma factor [Terrihabitans sp. B22-R8]|uniref:sigma-70 family RNA polymerase sigma factor n=1 Tax=Terrihabitans sp. B22-R8 TaxID=3425128 RepID=UPI00403CF19B
MAWDIRTLFQSHAAGVARSLRRRGLSEDLADDITQDTFVRALAMPPSDGAVIHNPQAYLYKMARNLSINHARRQQSLEMVNLSDDLVGQIADPAPMPDKVCYDRQLLKMTEDALAELPERTRIAFELHRLGEMTIIEVARRIGLSPTGTWGLIRDAYRHIVLRTGGL